MERLVIYTYETYVAFYKKNNRFPDGSYVAPSGYNDKQLKAKFDKYEKTLAKKKLKLSLPKKAIFKKLSKPIKVKASIPFTSSDPKWVELCEFIDKRDNNECCLLRLLTDNELKEYSDNYGNQNRLTHAHVLGRASHRNSAYKKNNVVCLNLASHSWLDQGCNPLNGKRISLDEQTAWWNRILKPYGLTVDILIKENLEHDEL